MFLSLFSLIGIIVGVRVAFEVSRVMLRRIIGAIIVVSGVVLILLARRTFAYHPWKVAVLSVVASFNKALSGGGYGPLVTSGQMLSGIEARAAVGITSLAEGFTCLGGAILFLLFGEGLDLALLIPVATGSLLSVPFPAQIVRLIREDAMKRVVAVLTVLLGALTLIRSFL